MRTVRKLAKGQNEVLYGGPDADVVVKMRRACACHKVKGVVVPRIVGVVAQRDRLQDDSQNEIK